MNETKDQRLDSWKEIAVFLKRGVRTVQRWERSEGLPVHRHKHVTLGSVYAFQSEVAAWWESRATSLGSSETPKDTKRVRLLVLPFENLGGDASQDYLADGFTEELITHLARLQPEQLAVIARTTSMHYRDSRKPVATIAHELGVDYVLGGSLRREGEHVRLSAHLVVASDQTHAWAQIYDRDAGSIFALQSELAEAIAREIRVTLIAPSSSNRGLQAGNARAYEAYLQGRYHLNRMEPHNLSQAVAWFQRAVEADPEYALAYASLSHAHALLAMVPYDVLPPHKTMPRAKAAAERALALNNTLAEAHVALAAVRHHYDWDWAGAEEAYLRGIELNPEYPGTRLRYAWLLLALSRTNEAQEQIDRAEESARETDPHLLVVIRATRAAAYYFARDYERCASECGEAMRLDESYFLTHYLLARAEIRKGSPGKARKILSSNSRTATVPLMQMAIGLLHALHGEKSEARAVRKHMVALAEQRYVPATYIGTLHAALGDTDGAFEWLSKAYEERADGLVLLNVDPMVDKLRKDARFLELIRKLRLTPQAN